MEDIKLIKDRAKQGWQLPWDYRYMNKKLQVGKMKTKYHETSQQII